VRFWLLQLSRNGLPALKLYIVLASPCSAGHLKLWVRRWDIGLGHLRFCSAVDLLLLLSNCNVTV